MRKHNLLKAVALTLCLAIISSGTAFADTPGQALDASEVKYGTISSADQKILKSFFNAEEYAAMNEDVVKAVGKNANKLFAHFVKCGIFEGRGPSKDFNVSAYKSSYGDLEEAFGDDIMAYYRHYNNYGKKEKRDLVTAEKAEAAGVFVKSAVPGATQTVLSAAQEVAKKAAASSSSYDSSYFANWIKYYSELNGFIAMADLESLQQSITDLTYEETSWGERIYYSEAEEIQWQTFRDIEANIVADRLLIRAATLTATVSETMESADASDVEAAIATAVNNISGLNYNDWYVTRGVADVATPYTSGAFSVTLFSAAHTEHVGPSGINVTVTFAEP